MYSQCLRGGFVPPQARSEEDGEESEHTQNGRVGIYTVFEPYYSIQTVFSLVGLPRQLVRIQVGWLSLIGRSRRSHDPYKATTRFSINIWCQCVIRVAWVRGQTPLLSIDELPFLYNWRISRTFYTNPPRTETSLKRALNGLSFARGPAE